MKTPDTIYREIFNQVRLTYEDDEIVGFSFNAPKVLEIINAAMADARAAERERCAELCLKIWKEAPNDRGEPGTANSYMQNKISHGCLASADAIRSLKDQA